MDNNFDIAQIKLIVGLGNIGREFTNTRHNIGFDFVEQFAETKNFLEEKKFKASVCESKIHGLKVILAKPTTMMNSSGEAVNQVSKFYKIKPQEILVVHDDLDIKLGAYKLHYSKGPKIHNGILSIENHLGTTNFWRLRLGVDNRDENLRKHISGADYVLSTFSTEERVVVDIVFKKIIAEWINSSDNMDCL
jgi:PTH1 family peptidyl-tRNA hydrolase